jgi:hypothetical protein
MMWPSTTSGCAALAKTEYATNKVNVQTLDFDSTVTEYAETTVVLDSWDGGTITVHVFWTANANFFNAVWQCEARSYGEDEALDAAWGTAVTDQSTNSAAGANRLSYGDSSIGPVTPAGTPAEGEMLQLRIARLPANVGDDLGVDARLIAIRVDYTKA